MEVEEEGEGRMKLKGCLRVGIFRVLDFEFGFVNVSLLVVRVYEGSF